MKKKHKRFLIFALIVLGAIQFISTDKTNPPVDPKLTFENTLQSKDLQFASTIKASCYSCHSNTTEYHWYSKIAPVSFWLNNHIKSGRNALNFSEWESYSSDKKTKLLLKAADVIEKKWMPIATYTWMHSEAKLTEIQREELVKWFRLR